MVIYRNKCNLLKQPFGSITHNSCACSSSIFAGLSLGSSLTLHKKKNNNFKVIDDCTKQKMR